jgi:F0F1-type ATP synthase epsilon subunit
MGKKAKTADSSAPMLQARVYSPYRVFYNGPAVSVSGINAHGPFDVLLGHINFFSLLQTGDVTVDTGKEGEEPVVIPISHGILHVREDKVTLFVFGMATKDDDEAEEGEAKAAA